MRAACSFLASHSTSDIIFMHTLVSILNFSFNGVMPKHIRLYTRSRTSVGHNFQRVQIQLKCSLLSTCVYFPSCTQAIWKQQQQQLLFMKIGNIFRGNFSSSFYEHKMHDSNICLHNSPKMHGAWLGMALQKHNKYRFLCAIIISAVCNFIAFLILM